MLKQLKETSEENRGDAFKRNKEMDISGESCKLLEESIRDLFKLNTNKIENDPEKSEIVERVKTYEKEERRKLKASEKDVISRESIKKS